jgi:hypothetical protein
MRSIIMEVAFSVMILLPLNLKSQKVDFRNQEKANEVKVYIDDRFFTAFIYPEDMEKQVLYPIVSASGKTITRGYPIRPRPYERTDHPHHVGMWFNFGDVNGLDFWNNSFAVKPGDKLKYGSIKFEKIVSEDPEEGRLVTSSFWEDNDGNKLLHETTTYLFSGSGNLRSIVRATRLTALREVTFNENKEGLIGIRMDRSFEAPSEKPEKFLDANGKETEVPVMNNEGVNGVYRNAEGITGGDVWGKRSRWVALRAEKEGEVITVVLIDNPENPNYPAWAHARGYGLFALNNLGGRNFDKNTEPVMMRLEKGEQAVFKYKVVIGGDLTDKEINDMALNFH